jgi:hypothetical protein
MDYTKKHYNGKTKQINPATTPITGNTQAKNKNGRHRHKIKYSIQLLHNTVLDDGHPQTRQKNHCATKNYMWASQKHP